MRLVVSGFIGLVALTPVGVTEAAANNVETGLYRIDVVAERGAPAIWDGAKVIVRDSSGAVVARKHAVPAMIDLPRDDGYRVTVIYKQAAGQTELAPGANTVNLRAGEVSLALVGTARGSSAPAPRQWGLHRYVPGRKFGRLVARSTERRPLFTLSAGWYEVRAEYPGGVTRHVIEVRAGRRFDYRIVADQ